MEGRLLQLFALWTTVAGIVQGCPEVCSCQDKLAHQFVDCAYKDLLVVPVGLPSNVTTVSLSANKIKLLKSKNFVNITQVTSLWLAHNEIVTIETDTLAPLIQLRNLDISYNKIVNFPWEDLHNLTALQLLKMNNNEMVSLPKDAFSTLQDLSLEWLRDWITTTKISVPDQNSIECKAPENLKGTLVTNIPKLDCRAPTVTITHQSNTEITELHEGFLVVLNCETKGSPKPQVSWDVIAGNQNYLFLLPSTADINDAPINDQTTNNRFLVFRNGTLVIPRMSKKEDGNYSCSAVNDLGKAEASVRVALSGDQKHAINSVPDSAVDKIHPSAKKPTEPKASKNGVNTWTKPEKKTKSSNASSDKADNTEVIGGVSTKPKLATKCGVRESSKYVSNHAFNMSLENLKQYTFDFGVISLEVSETKAKVKLNPLQLPSHKTNLHLSQPENQETVNKEPASLYQASSSQSRENYVYLCVDTGNGYSMIKWSQIEQGLNTYHFQGLQPGTNYTLCVSSEGQDCQVQVVFTTRKKIPSLLIIVVVSIFLLALATVPLLGATCCHLLYKYQGKTYKLIMKAHNPDQMEKQMAGDFDRRASFVESEKTFNPSELGEGEGEEGDAEGEAEGSVVTESIPGSSSKTNQEEFEVGSEYSDRLPLGAEAVNISEEINGNYKPPTR
uniref:Immunoglobulin superfamily containing leucine-rich repeat 2 n=1 Tax=Echeneis naucrates TaxID=173247 RepID=A0A665WA01_ECHNA